ncbi:n-acetyl transferase, partial [Thalassiosira pseudonana CCMP1335]
LDDVMRLVGQDLSEPYSVFTYRYFLHRWPQLCILAVPTDDDKSEGGHRRPIGCVVCKIDPIYDQTDKIITLDTQKIYSGYIGMLAVEDEYRRSGIGTALVERAIHLMKEMGCQSIKLETEVTNKGAMRLYEDRFGFVREELLVKYYLNWGDAYRLRLWLDG